MKECNISEVISTYNELCALHDFYYKIYEIYIQVFLDLKQYLSYMRKSYKHSIFGDIIISLKFHKLTSFIKKVNMHGEDGKEIIDEIDNSLSKGKDIDKEEQKFRCDLIYVAFINLDNQLNYLYYIRNKYGYMLDRSKMYYGVMDNIRRSYLKLKENSRR